MIPKIVLGLFLLATFIQLVYWVYIFSKLAFYKSSGSASSSDERITVIIAAKNEAQNLQNNLLRILNQNYRSQHVIVVNDNSTDSTAQSLLEIQKYHKTFTIVNATDAADSSGKKSALTLGIDQANTDVLLFTDADCTPTSDEWSSLMHDAFDSKKDLVLGYGPYTKTRGWLNKWIRMDSVMIAIQYLSMAILGKPYMGVGRNIAYRKTLFNSVNGFDSHQHEMSGDDDLFVQETANKSNTAVVLDARSFMYSPAKSSISEFLHQKARHLTTGKTYKLSDKFLLGGFVLSLMIYYTGGIGLLLWRVSVQLVTVVFLVRLFIAWGIFGKIATKLKEEDLTTFFPIWELSYLLLQTILVPTFLTYKPTKWKQ